MATNSSGAPRLAIEISVDGVAKAQKEFTGLRRQLIETDKEFKKANSTVLELERELNSLSNRLKTGAISQKQFSREQKEIAPALASARQAAQQYERRISSLNATIAQGSNAGRSYGNSIGQLQGVHNSVTSGIRGASTVSLEFGRILQDLPYGMQGVANNIQQLTTNLGFYTKNVRESYKAQGLQASNMTVFRGVLSSLLSPMSLITLGISAVTAGWVAWEKWQGRASKATKDAEKSLTAYIESLKGVERALADGQVNYQKEISSLNQLYKATQNTNIPMSERIKYAKEIIKQGGEIFESTSAEAIVAGEASKEYDKLSVSIQKTALAQAYMQKMTENATTALNNNLEAVNEANKIIEINRRIEQTRATISTSAAGASVGQSGAAQYREIANLEKQRNESVKNIQRIGKETGKVMKEQEVLQKSINNALETGGSLLDKSDNKTKKIANSTKKISDLTDSIVRDSLNSYDAKLFDIQKKYENIYKTVSNPEILALARQNEETEKLKVGVDRVADSVVKLTKEYEKLTRQSTRAGITLAGISVPSSLPNLERASANINKPIVSNLTDDFTEQFQSTLNRGVSDSLNTLFSGLGDWGSKAYDIEKKYNDLRSNASAQEIESLNEMERLERRINNGLTNTLSKLGTSLASIGGNMLSSAISSGISSGEFDDLRKMFRGDNKAMGYGAAASLAGNLLGGVLRPSDVTGQTLSGALSGGGTGAAIGTAIAPGIGTALGAIGGAIIGGISSLFGSKARKREEELAEQQLKVQRDMLALQQRQAMLSYTSQVIGQMTNQGAVTSIERDALGNLETKIRGKDIALVLERNNSGRG